MNKNSYRVDIDGLRMIAVLPVVFNHAGLPGFPGGFIGVDIFFVISGYLITRILTREIEEQRFSILSFYERRARRILPALFVVLAVCLAVGWWLLSPYRYEALGKSIIATLVFASNIWFWFSAGDYFGPNVEIEPLLHTWSLAVEEQFYLFFPLLLLAISSLKRTNWIVIVWAIVALSFGLSIWMTQAAPTTNFYLIPSRVWELGAGSLLALGAFATSRHQIVHEIAGWTGILLIGASIFLITAQTPFPGLAALPPVLGATLVIYSGTDHTVSAKRFLSWRPFVWIGLISYSLYLWHWPILVAARNLNHSAELPMPTAIICILLAIGLAWLSWRYVERPFRTTTGPSSISRPWIFSMSAVGIVALGLFSSFVILKNGIIRQVPQDSLAVYRRAIERDPLDIGCMNAPTPCLIGAPSVAPSVFIWGDSHASATLPGFDDWLRTVGASALTFTKSACPPLLDVWRVDVGPNHNCDGHNADALATITETPTIDTVILFARWSLATEGTRAEREPGNPAILALSGETSTDVSGNAELVYLGLNRAVEALRLREINVIIIRGTPEIGTNVPNMVLGQDNESQNTVLPTRTDVDQRNERADQIIDEIAERRDVLVLSPRDLLCAETCLIQIEGKPLYRDDDHLSAFGARWLIPNLMHNVDLR
jgi:peptidoglycan/LPS O-acetylase OafA/YrhL